MAALHCDAILSNLAEDIAPFFDYVWARPFVNGNERFVKNYHHKDTKAQRLLCVLCAFVVVIFFGIS